METKTLRIIKGDDFHCHLREGNILQSVIGFTARQFKRAIIMPNLTPPILTAEDAEAYGQEIFYAGGHGGFEPLMTIQITDDTTPAIISEADEAGVKACKIYLRGTTTNSQNGVTDFKKLRTAFQEMQKRKMRALIHGEDPAPGVFCLDREESFLPTLVALAQEFPDLKIVLEHIATEKAGLTVALLKNVAATITAHHLLLTLDDVVGGLIAPHNFCKPIAKRPKDRNFLITAATSETPSFSLAQTALRTSKRKKSAAMVAQVSSTHP